MQFSPSTNAIQLSQSAGLILIGIDELAVILHRAPATVRTQVSREPDKLPPRFILPSDPSNPKGKPNSAVVWLLSAVWSWLAEQAGKPAAPAPTTPSDKPVKRRGAPTAAEKLAARNAGYASVAEYRSAQEVQ